MTRLNYLSKTTLDELYAGILENIERYKAGDFNDFVAAGGWNIQLETKVDLELLEELDPSGGSAAEVRNSLIVWKALHGLTPALACEDRIWTRLSHVECLCYARERWLRETDDQATARDVRTHLFAPSLTGCRDDHAISRLWWNARIAKNLRPDDQKGALELILKTADIRSNFVERSWTSSRESVAGAILGIMEREPSVTESEDIYRRFMKAVNRLGGGVVFEALSRKKLDDFLDDCLLTALEEAAQ